VRNALPFPEEIRSTQDFLCRLLCLWPFAPLLSDRPIPYNLAVSEHANFPLQPLARFLFASDSVPDLFLTDVSPRISPFTY
jgi:hypothetical protein